MGNRPIATAVASTKLKCKGSRQHDSTRLAGLRPVRDRGGVDPESAGEEIMIRRRDVPFAAAGRGLAIWSGFALAQTNGTDQTRR